MKGNRKLLIGLYYLTGIFVIAGLVVCKRYDNLIGVGALATGLASGVGAVMWGNAQEHKAAATIAVAEKKEN